VKYVYRYEVPVDDRWHAVEIRGPILHVGGRSMFTVEFWAIYDTAGKSSLLEFRVFGTGQPLERAALYVGTVVIDKPVWHLFQRRTIRDLPPLPPATALSEALLVS